MTKFTCFLLAIALPVLTAGATESSEATGVWLGSAPICRSKPKSCERLDLLFARSDHTGDGGKCWIGKKVLCKLRPLPKQLKHSDASKLTLVSYNVFARPYLVSHDGQRERTCRIPRALLSEVPSVDVIVFQEAFLSGCLSNTKQFDLRGLLKSYGFEHSTRTVGLRRWGIRINGGVFIASRWPIVQQAQMVYRNSHRKTADSLSNKGAVHAIINKMGNVYHVFGTHMQAHVGPEYQRYRELQADELRQFVESRVLEATQPVLIAGDFNADMLRNRNHLNRLLDKLSASLPSIHGQVGGTYDPTQNDLVEAAASTSKMWIDYVVHSRNHKVPTSATLRAVRLLADKEMNICVSAPLQLSHVSADSIRCRKTASTRDLSDHFPVVAEYRFS